MVGLRPLGTATLVLTQPRYIRESKITLDFDLHLSHIHSLVIAPICLVSFFKSTVSIFKVVSRFNCSIV